MLFSSTESKHPEDTSPRVFMIQFSEHNKLTEEVLQEPNTSAINPEKKSIKRLSFPIENQKPTKILNQITNEPSQSIFLNNKNRPLLNKSVNDRPSISHSSETSLKSVLSSFGKENSFVQVNEKLLNRGIQTDFIDIVKTNKSESIIALSGSQLSSLNSSRVASSILTKQDSSSSNKSVKTFKKLKWAFEPQTTNPGPQDPKIIFQFKSIYLKPQVIMTHVSSLMNEIKYGLLFELDLLVIMNDWVVIKKLFRVIEPRWL